MTSLLGVLLCLNPRPAGATTSTLTIIADSSTTSDAWLREDAATSNFGTSIDVRVLSSANQANRNSVIRIPLSGLTGKTVLQAWLDLKQLSATSATPIDARIYALSEAFVEARVTWARRDSTNFLNFPFNWPWIKPGGTHGAAWTDRQLISTDGNNKSTRFQVGPIVQSWNSGATTNNGFVIAPTSTAPSREAVFGSSDYPGNSWKPSLVVQYTDSPPALASGTAEIQPHTVHAGGENIPLTVWLAVDALGTTPSGTPTGFDLLTLSHRGALTVTGIDSLRVGTTRMAGSAVTWSDDGLVARFYLPRIAIKGTVELSIRADLLASANADGIDLPMLVDDSATPGAAAQALWSGNADGTAGNGDDWVLGVIGTPPVAIDLMPDTAQIADNSCLQLACSMRDAGGNVFTLPLDSVAVRPATGGTITTGLQFCANGPGNVQLIACYATLRDTSIITVMPDRIAVIGSVTLRDAGGQATSTMTPGDTMFVDVRVSEGDGLRDLSALQFDILNAATGTTPSITAYGASFGWKRGSAPSWGMAQPTGTTWQALPASCVMDESSNKNSPTTARLAFVVSPVARASLAGEWSVRVRATSDTPLNTTDTTLTGINVPARLVIKAQDTGGCFGAGAPGTARLPLAIPANSQLHYLIEANTSYVIDGQAADLVGQTNPLDTLHVRAAQGDLRWSSTANPDDGGALGTDWQPLILSLPQDDDQSISAYLHLWIDYPLTMSPQGYAGALALRLRASAFGDLSDVDVTQLKASIVTTGLAADSALAEITPHSVIAGTTAQALTASLLPLPRPGNTGVDIVRVGLPSGYGAATVAGVRVAGNPVAFSDLRLPGAAAVSLDSKVTSGELIDIYFTADTPLDVDPDGSVFVVVYDDQSTAATAQTAAEGNANGIADGDSWKVRVSAGPLARMMVSPSSAAIVRGRDTTFTAMGTDAFGHPVAATPTWRVEGGVGTVGTGSGLFTATTFGTGRVIAEVNGVADTAAVTVTVAPGLVVLSVGGPATLVQGQTGAQIYARIRNTSSVSVQVDTLQLEFGRAVAGDANGDFTVTNNSPLPATLAAGSSALCRFTVDVRANALVAPLTVQALVSGVETMTSQRLRDATADTSLASSVLPGGLQFSATGTGASARPGGSNVLILSLSAANQYQNALTLKQLTLTNITTGPGTHGQLDDELGIVSLYHDDGDGNFEPAQDTLIFRTAAFNGQLLFAPTDVWLAPLATTRLFVACDLPLSQHDGDVLQLQLTALADVGVTPAPLYRNSWPVSAGGGVAVDGFVAAQLVATAVGPSTLNPGAKDKLAFEVLLPGNGYAADVLTRLSVGNAGTAVPEDDIHRLRVWIDDGDAVFTKPSEHLLGTLAYTGGGRWQLTGLTQAIPAEGARLFVTVDAASTAAQSATIKLFLPSYPDPGVGMSSGNSGPLDLAVTNPSQLTLSNADRIVLGSMTLAGGTARPGTRQLPLVGMTATNTYTIPRTLTTLVFQNTTTGPGTQAELDGEAKLLSLRADGNGNGVLEGVDADPVLSTGFFQSGRATFTGLAITVPAGSTRTLFLTADLSTSGARDGDVVSARMDDANGVDFSELTAVAGLFPLDSGAGWTVDGLMAVQITNLGAAGATVGPGDGPILALDVIVPRNGYASDLLRGLRITNIGSATPADLSQVQLWRDGGDGAFSGGGDDMLLGPLTPTGGDWTSPLLSTPVGAAGLRLFVSVNIAATPAETTTVRFAIPAGGVEYESTNDGPLDGVVANPEGILLSSSPLLAAIMAPRASTIGQLVTVSMAIRNKSNETVRNVAAPVLELLGTAPFTRVSGPLPAAIDIAPSTTDTISWTYTADGVGDARFSAVAGGSGDPSGLPRNAPRANSNAHRVYLAARNLDLTPVQTMPIRVNRGQRGVVPFSLTLVHPGGADASDVRVDRLRIRLEEENGAPIVPSSLLDGVEVNEGTNVYLSQTGVETSGSAVDMLLATPLTVTGTQPATISLRLNIAPSTTVPTFRVVFDDSTNIGGHDATSGAPVTVHIDGAAYPLRSELASIVAEATRIDMAPLGPDTVRTSPGQPEATLMRLSLTSPGITGITSNVRVTSLAVALTVSAGADLALPGSAFSEVRLKSGFSTVARRVLTALDADNLVLAFTPPIELAANTPLELTLVGDLTAGAAFGSYGSRLLDSARVDARDVNTRTRIPAQYAAAVVRGGTVIVEGPADTARVRGTAALPAAVVIGEADVLAITATLRHPGQPGSARLRCDGLTLQLVDDLRRPLVPAGTIGRLRVLWNGVDQANITNLPSSGDRVIVPLPGLLLEPGDTAGVEVRVDIDAAAPAGFLELVVPFGELIVRDANTGLTAALTAEAGALLPLHSGLGRLSPPARDLAFGLTSLMPAALAGDSRAVPSARLTLRNTDEQGVGPIDVDHLVVRCADRLFVAQAIGRGATQIEAWHNGTLWAQSAPLTTDSSTATLEAGTRLTIPPGSTATVELRMVTRSGAIVAGVRLGLDRAGVGVVQPASALLAINVGPESGQVFPMWTASGVLAEAGLEASYVNFPNPFAAGREATTVAYFMPSAGRVTLRVLTARGELVTTLLDGTSRGAGLQQADRWDGRNGHGDVVVNGVYIAELDIHLDDGTSKRLRRKLAVVR